MKKIFSMFLTVMCFVCVAFAGLAFLPKADLPTVGSPEVETRYDEGSGSSSDPFIISSAEDFFLIYEDINNSNSGHYYMQVCNIEIPLQEWLNSYSVSGYFTGVYNGGGFCLYIGSVNVGISGFCGLFPGADNAIICNLIVVGDYGGNGGGSGSGIYGVGGIVGGAFESVISRCAFIGNVFGGECTNMIVGGIAGLTYNSVFSECYYRGVLSSWDTENGSFGGGIVGASYSFYNSAWEDTSSEIVSCLAMGEFNGFVIAGGIVGISTVAAIASCVAEMYPEYVDNMGGIVGAHCFIDHILGENDCGTPTRGFISNCVSVFDAPVIVFGIDVYISNCWYEWGAYEYSYSPDFYDPFGNGSSYIDESEVYNGAYGHDYDYYAVDYCYSSAGSSVGFVNYIQWINGEGDLDSNGFTSSGFQCRENSTELLPDVDYTFYINECRCSYYYETFYESNSIDYSGYYIPLLTWFEAQYVVLWDTSGNFVECGHIADYTNNFEDVSEYEQGGDYLDGVKPTYLYLELRVCELGETTYSRKNPSSGFIATITYTDVNSVRKTVTGNSLEYVAEDALADTNATITVSVDGYVCMGIWLTEETQSTSSEVISRTVNLGKGPYNGDFYLRDIFIYLKKVSNNQLKSYFFEDGTFPQTAVVTYNTSLNTLLTNKQTSSTPSFTSNGTTYYTLTYSYSSSDGAQYQVYNGQKFLGFVYSNDTKTIKLKDKTGSLISCTFTKGTTYWFKYEPIRWRVTNYNASASDLPDDFDEFAEGQIDFSVVTDVLWWDVLNSSSNNLGAGDSAMQTTFSQALSNGALFGGMDFDYLAEGKAYEIDEFNTSSSNKKVLTTTNGAVKMRYVRITSHGWTGAEWDHTTWVKAIDSAGNTIVLADAANDINKSISGYMGDQGTYFEHGRDPVLVFDIGSLKSITKIGLFKYSTRQYYGIKVEYSSDNVNWFTYWDSYNKGRWTDPDGDGTYTKTHDATNLYNESSSGHWFTLGAMRVASVSEVEKYQSELGSYGSQLACVMAGVDQNKFLEYWTRDFGQQMGCGTYVTASGEVMKNSYYANKARGIRFAITMSEGSNMG